MEIFYEISCENGREKRERPCVDGRKIGENTRREQETFSVFFGLFHLSYHQYCANFEYNSLFLRENGQTSLD